MNTTGVACRADCVERRRRFEAEHPDVTITTPPTLLAIWRAELPAGHPHAGTVTAWSLCNLMDHLDGLYPPGGL